MGLRIANSLFKIAIVSANESLGLGKSRIERLLEAINLKMSKIVVNFIQKRIVKI